MGAFPLLPTGAMGSRGRRSSRWLAVRWVAGIAALSVVAVAPAAAGGGSDSALAALAQRLDGVVAANLDARSLVATARPSVVSLYRFDASGHLEGYATGFVVGATPFILTSAHAVEGASRLAVALDDGTLVTGARYLADAASDVAVVVAPLPQVPPALRPATEEPPVGAPVLVLGNGLGLRAAAVRGMVSGYAPGGVLYPTLVLDAAVQPGHSGSPVLDGQGRVVAMVASTRRDSGRVTYAVPAAVIQHVLRLLQGSQGFVRPWLGILAQESFYATYGLRSEAGLRVLAVAPGSAAAAAGLAAGDEIVAVGGEPVHSLVDLRLALDGHDPGEPLALRVRRQGEERTVEVRPGLDTSVNPGPVPAAPVTTAQGNF